MGIFKHFKQPASNSCSTDPGSVEHDWVDDKLTRDISSAHKANCHASRNLEATIQDFLDSISARPHTHAPPR